MAPPKTSVPRPGRALAALAALILVLLIAVVGKDAFDTGKWHKHFAVKLGLDLSSGTTVTLQAVTPTGGTPPAANMQRALQIIRDRVNGSGITEAQVTQQGKDIITVAVPGVGQQRVVALVGKTAQLRFRQVLLEASNAPAVSPSPNATSTPGSSSSPSPRASHPASPSPSPSGHALGRAAGTAGGGSLGLASRRLAAGPSPTPATTPSPSAPATSQASPPPSSPVSNPAAGLDTSGVSPAVLSQFAKLDCSKPNWRQDVGYNPNVEDDPNAQIVSCSQDGRIKYVLEVAKVEGTSVTGAAAVLPPVGSSVSTQWQVNLNFDSTGAKQFGDLTTQMYNAYGGNGNATSARDQLAVVLDGVVISSPNINQGPITGGSAQITGNFNQKSATDLANVLKFGALPLKLNQQAVNTVSPSLGHDQLTGGLVAAAIGMLLVIVYSLLYYRGLGLVAISSLLVSAILTYLSVLVLSRYRGFALSLAGIAGLVVAIGITADSFVVFFERLRDEVREGNTLRTAVERGWRRARRTILVSDTVSFLAALFLYQFAIGDVRGFAFTLGLTTIIDVVVVFLFTKPMITLAAGTKFYGGGHPLSGLDPARLGARVSWRASPRPAPAGAARASAAPPGGAQAAGGRGSDAEPSGGNPRQGGLARPRTRPKEA